MYLGVEVGKLKIGGIYGAVGGESVAVGTTVGSTIGMLVDIGVSLFLPVAATVGVCSARSGSGVTG